MGWLTNVEYQQTRTADRDGEEGWRQVYLAKCGTPRTHARTRAGPPKTEKNTSTTTQEIYRPATE
jgi:hypothetical protein